MKRSLIYKEPAPRKWRDYWLVGAGLGFFAVGVVIDIIVIILALDRWVW